MGIQERKTYLPPMFWIGGRVKGEALQKCIRLIRNHKDLGIFGLSIDSFLNKTADEKDILTCLLSHSSSLVSPIFRMYDTDPEIFPSLMDPNCDSYGFSIGLLVSDDFEVIRTVIFATRRRRIPY
jgi:hypothetical protein